MRPTLERLLLFPGKVNDSRMESSVKIKHTFIEHVLAVDIHSSPAYNKMRPKKSVKPNNF